jgi:hypothetical protein
VVFLSVHRILLRASGCLHYHLSGMVLDSTQHVWLALLCFGGMLFYPLLLLLLWYRAWESALVLGAGVAITYVVSGWHGTCGQFDTLGSTPEFRTPFICLLHPHGLFCEMAGFFLLQMRFPPRTTLLIDPRLYWSSPLAVIYLRLRLSIGVSYLKHTNILHLRQQNHNLILFPGGFREAVGFYHGYDPLYFHLYRYWMRIARTYPQTKLYSVVLYGASSYCFQQSSWIHSIRCWLAQYAVPCILPCGVTSPLPFFRVKVRYHTWDLHQDTIYSIMTRVKQVACSDGFPEVTCLL